MWDGPGPGPRRWRGPHFRDHRGGAYRGRDHPLSNFRERGGMNMGPMGHIGPRHFDMPPMDMRRMDSPPMRGRDMDSQDMGGPGGREFFRHAKEPNFNLSRQVEISYKKTFVNTNFGGPERDPDNLNERNMPSHEPGNRFMDRDQDNFDRPPFYKDGRRGFPMDRNDRFREERDRSPMGMQHIEGFDMNVPPRERRVMNMERREGPPFTPRGAFDSDMDFRDCPGPMPDFRGKDRSPPRFGNDPVPPVDRGRSEIPQEERDNRTTENPPNDDGGDSPLTDYRCGEEMTLAEEWKNRKKDKNPFLTFSKGFGGTNEPKYPIQYGRDQNIRNPLHFQERDRMTVDYPPKDVNFPPMDLPGRKGPQDFMQPLKDPLNRENENKSWLEDRDLKHRPPPPNVEMPPLPHGLLKSSESFQDMSHNQELAQTKMDKDVDLSCNSGPPRDQDYRDIDYRTASTAFDFKLDSLTPDTLISESKLAAPVRFESASQDQDYRGAAFEDPVSNTISIAGIPKTATMEQILGALSTPDGVPLQAMKMKTVVPGYSYDTAIVEFLNLEDAVHIMESNKVAHPHHSARLSLHLETRG